MSLPQTSIGFRVGPKILLGILLLALNPFLCIRKGKPIHEQRH